MTPSGCTLFETPIGTCGIAWGERGIFGVQLPMPDVEKTRKRIQQRYAGIQETPPPTPVQRSIASIVELLAGQPNDLSDIELDLEGVPAFNRGVYDIARGIPPGKTLTYGDIARRL